MKKNKIFKDFVQNKLNRLLDKQIKISFDKKIFQRNLIYQKTKAKIYDFFNSFQDKIKSLKSNNNKNVISQKDFNCISIYFAENQLKISRNIENKNKIIVKKNIALKIPNNVVDGDKVLEFETLIKIIGDIISVIGDTKMPILLNLNSKYFKLKVSKKRIFFGKR